MQAGLTYNVNDNLKIDFSYRFLNLGSPQTAVVQCQNTTSCPGAFYTLRDFTSQDFRIGLRWVFPAGGGFRICVDGAAGLRAATAICPAAAIRPGAAAIRSGAAAAIRPGAAPAIRAAFVEPRMIGFIDVSSNCTNGCTNKIKLRFYDR